MTREEAIIDLKAKITRIKSILDDGLCANPDRWAIKLKWHEDMLSALHSPQPDPITGLVPCGCGGRAKQEDFFDGFFYFGAIKCPGCEIEIRIPSLTPEESSDRVKVAWNRAMDWKSGADITPMSGEVCK